ncbi:MAG TPA: right-handed parallel beta-helix repeat-containing protein, partial [Candidatus Saccharimonadales bacterium]|nr:right-handed parallel beta-helix repeat-containing protein [Candidatus Saccharimonadales bacterium]
TVYFLEPGLHVGSMYGLTDDAFVGGRANGVGTTLDGNYARDWAIDGYDDPGYTATNVTLKYLTVQHYNPPEDHNALNQGGDPNFNVYNSTIIQNAPGGGLFLATDSTVKNTCMTQNGQYGFQSAETIKKDSLTQGPYNLHIENNEISYNDTCNLAGPLNNAALGWVNYNPVPPQYYDNVHCDGLPGDGNQGGFKLWQTNGVTVKNNWIHHNWGTGIWADTNNANLTIDSNTITYNDGPAISIETTYNFSITNNYMEQNDIAEALTNTGFPSPAVWISESGSDTQFGGIPACSEPSCASQPSYPTQSVVQNNTMVDNGGGVFLWQNSNRYCGAPIDGTCDLIMGGEAAGTVTMAHCNANLPSVSLNTNTYVGTTGGTPSLDWIDACYWKTENVDISNNEIDLNPSHVLGCTPAIWEACGYDGVYSEYGGAPFSGTQPWMIPTAITFWQNNHWHNNVYHGPTLFNAYNQGSGDNPLTWAQWTGPVANGDKCSNAGERQSGYCTGPFGQDAGSTYDATPLQGTKVGDFNNDSAVNITDLSMLLTAYNTSNSTILTNLNRTGKVDITCLSIFLTHWGT